MRKRLLTGLVVLVLAAVPAWAADKPVESAAKKTDAPGVVVRIAAIDTLLADIKYVAAFTDQEENVKQLEGMVKARSGPKGLQGIDTKKPLGLYGNVGAQGLDSTVVLMIPVADEKAFLELLKGLNLKTEEGKDGLYTLKVEQSPFPIYFRFANGYAYATIQDAAAIAPEALLTPAKVLPAEQVGLVSATVRLDQVPDEIKQLAIGQLGLHLAEARDRELPNETKAQKEFKKQAVEEVSQHLKAAIKDGQELTARLDVDRTKNDLSGELTLTGKEGSKLATSIADFGKAKSVLGGLLTPDAAAQGIGNVALPESLHKALAAVVDESMAQALAKEQDKAKREQAEKFLKALEPSLKAGEFDGALVLKAPAAEGKHHTLVGGIKLKDGQGLEKAFRDMVKDLPAGDRDRIKLDADSAGSVKIHRIDAQKDFDEGTKKAFGDGPVYAAFRNDALLFAMGDDALPALKAAVVALPKTGPQLMFEANLRRLTAATAIQRKGDPAVAKAADEAFGKETGNDHVLGTIEGGKALKARFEMKAPVLKYLDLLQKAEQKDKDK